MTDIHASCIGKSLLPSHALAGDAGGAICEWRGWDTGAGGLSH